MLQHNLQPFVNRLTSHSVLSTCEQQAILSLPSRSMQVASNHDFVRFREHADHAFLVLRGLIGSFDQTSAGRRQITSLHIPGDMAGLLSLVQPTATIALQAFSTATILQVPRPALRAVADEHAAIGRAFWRDCTIDAMILAHWLVNVGRRDARSRIAHLLCEMACRFGAGPQVGPVQFDLAMTQSHLADATGLTPVHVNRSLKALVADGVTFRSRTVRIEDWARLVAIAEFDGAYLHTGTRPQKCSLINQL